jgi:hypothetical protein
VFAGAAVGLTELELTVSTEVVAAVLDDAGLIGDPADGDDDTILELDQRL